MYGGYGSICKREVHRPGSLLYYNLKDSQSKVDRRYNVHENFDLLANPVNSTPIEDGSTFRGSLQEAVVGAKEKMRFAPDVPTRSLSYRFDNVNLDTPNSYPEFTSSCRGTYVPRYTRGQRKDTAGCTSCKAPKQFRGLEENGGLDPILDPKFNLREVAKHMILLEDHLFQQGRRCDDCINKHRLTLEAFLEEAITLDKTGEHRPIIVDTLTKFKQIMREFVDKVRRNPVNDVNAVYYATADKLRVIRKPLCMAYCDFC